MCYNITVAKTTAAYAVANGGIAQLGERLNGIQEVRGSTPLISTIVEPVEPHGLAGFSLCSKVCGVDDMPVSDRYSFPKRQTEIPTDLFRDFVGIIVLRIFVEDFDFVIEQDDLVDECVNQELRLCFQRV